jgi:hypothetical protein
MMTEKIPTPEPQHPILALHARALERAAAYAANGGDFIDAIRPLLQFARDAGLVASLGPQTIEAITFAAFCLPASSKRRH